MKVTIEKSWAKVLQPEFQKPYFTELVDFVRKEYSKTQCFPPGKAIFAAFDYCPFDRVKVVILGQDPYHGYQQANGLCFSVQDGIPLPPSLVNIFQEIKSDIGKDVSQTGNLERWARQGVLLLNATLTVQAHTAGSHQGKGWEQFTDEVIRLISNQKEGVVFLLWGGYAKRKGAVIDKNKHLVLQSGHPSPLSANRGYWFGNKHFSKTNDYLEKKGLTPIEW